MKKKLFVQNKFVLFIILFIAVELISYYVIKNTNDLYYKVMSILELQQDLSWSNKTNFSGTFLNHPLKTNSLGIRAKPFSMLNNENPNIIAAGPSSTFGWAVNRNETYSSLLEEILPKETKKVFNVINAGQVGYSSWQGLKFMEKEPFLNLKPSFIIIAYGINDLDRFRFFYSDGKADKISLNKNHSSFRIASYNFLYNFNSMKILSRTLHKFLHSNACRLPSKFIKNPVPEMRVSIPDVINNIQNIASLYQKQNTKIILMGTAYKPKYSRKYEKISSKKLNLARTYFNKGKEAYLRKNFSSAEKYFLQFIENNPYDSSAHYYLSYLYKMKKDCKNYQNHFHNARQNEIYRIVEELNKLNNEIKLFAIKHKITFIDIAKLLNNEPKYFIDPVHFSSEGHQLIAKQLAASVIKLLP